MGTEVRMMTEVKQVCTTKATGYRKRAADVNTENKSKYVHTPNFDHIQ